MSTLALSHVAPGGTAPGAALGYRLLTQSGVSGADTGFALGTQGIGSAVVLNALFWLALVAFVLAHGFHAPDQPRRRVVGVGLGRSWWWPPPIGVVLLGAFGALFYLLTRGQERAPRSWSTGWPSGSGSAHPDRVDALVDAWPSGSRLLMDDRPLLYRALGWATANWLLDAASLWVFVAAFSHFISPVDLMVAYGLANILAAIPITPGGLGVVEFVLVSMITGLRAHRRRRRSPGCWPTGPSTSGCPSPSVAWPTPRWSSSGGPSTGACRCSSSTATSARSGVSVRRAGDAGPAGWPPAGPPRTAPGDGARRSARRRSPRRRRTGAGSQPAWSTEPSRPPARTPCGAGGPDTSSRSADRDGPGDRPSGAAGAGPAPTAGVGEAGARPVEPVAGPRAGGRPGRLRRAPVRQTAWRLKRPALSGHPRPRPVGPEVPGVGLSSAGGLEHRRQAVGGEPGSSTGPSSRSGGPGSAPSGPPTRWPPRRRRPSVPPKRNTLECSRNRPTMDRTRMCSESPGTPGAGSNGSGR